MKRIFNATMITDQIKSLAKESLSKLVQRYNASINTGI